MLQTRLLTGPRWVRLAQIFGSLASNNLLGILVTPDVNVILALQAVNHGDCAAIAGDLFDVLVTFGFHFLRDKRSELSSG